MSLTTKEYLARLARGVSPKASCGRKVGNETRTQTLRVMPTDLTDDAYIEVAESYGVDAKVQLKTEEGRTKSASAKEIFGKDAVELVCDSLGVSPPAAEPPKPRKKNKDAEPAPATAEPAIS
jgi:bisphosphoglycerate-dependent phosphoglycerate mutase